VLHGVVEAARYQGQGANVEMGRGIPFLEVAHASHG